MSPLLRSSDQLEMYMKTKELFLTIMLAGAFMVMPAQAHRIGEDVPEGSAHHHDFSVAPPVLVMLGAAQLKPDTVLMAQAKPGAAPIAAKHAPGMVTHFEAFAPKVKTRTDGKFLYVESDGMPAHNMMVGITAWQQQVPLPQPYTGNNAWRIPLQPVPAKEPVSIKGRFLRGAVALAVNGIPIFNPQNNRGEISQEIGELDQWGGHCGRADDYHYHATPFHLESVVGKGKPVAYALDGYPIYGLTEPDGSTPTKLDAFNGHETPELGYHYHGSNKYPYVNGGFHGEVTEAGGQVDPQPRAQGVREALTALRGARITEFTGKEKKQFSLKYVVGNETRYVNYALNDNGTVKFDFVDGRGQVKSEVYSPRQGGGGGNRPPGEPKGKEGQKKGKGGERPPGGKGEPKGADSARQPWMKVHASEMDGNKDGVLTRDELNAEVTAVFKGYDRNQDSKLARDEYEGGSQVRSAMGGFVKQHASEVDADHDAIITLAEVQATARRMFEKADTNGDGKLSKDELTLPAGYVATPPENSGKK
jgi:hypothetical protein